MDDYMRDPNAALQQWEIITGFVLPLIIAMIQKQKWMDRTRALVMFGVSAVVVGVQMFLNGQLDNLTDPVMSTLTVVVLTIGFYKGVWKPLGTAPTIERNVLP